MIIRLKFFFFLNNIFKSILKWFSKCVISVPFQLKIGGLGKVKNVLMILAHIHTHSN